MLGSTFARGAVIGNIDDMCTTRGFFKRRAARQTGAATARAADAAAPRTAANREWRREAHDVNS
ncbi:hypothetical protein [Burkholderia pseudomallei]|uniref:hypothetical protein n=1 Tax=Burkholderia pseudomallei TaxID=28450 RepID=UPI00014F974A|nr:hypothetical protein [Burkholderia pseudomallei]EBA45098.1 hypothetical protein BURPS305_0739 [Burkholderia pseudomallei 305]APZ18255.1 hypothetical protein BGI47_06140 [Burkholderia pseudomallei]APZ24450.1 hypothetical protein BGI46_06135 [Burkholderia pseudomallei]MBM5620001.1 hypothetical protein [Burkholderia pseudomallei]MBM5629517.1 hypothetical protein [Burkholderia pseudomallei]